MNPEALSWSGDPAQAPVDDDLQLSLWLAYELHYRGLAEVEEQWEWHPELIAARTRWEQHFLRGLRHHVPVREPDAAVVETLIALAGADAEPSLSKFLMREATSAQFAEFLAHRSLYHLKEADPHSWAIPRLSGSPKGALISIQSDEYGSGVPAAMHARLFRGLLRDWQMRTDYAGYLDHAPGVTLMASNRISLFGLHRRWRGALVGHLTLFEMTSSTPNARYACGHRRLGGGDGAALFFDEHVVADAVHDRSCGSEPRTLASSNSDNEQRDSFVHWRIGLWSRPTLDCAAPRGPPPDHRRASIADRSPEQVPSSRFRVERRAVPDGVRCEQGRVGGGQGGAAAGAPCVCHLRTASVGSPTANGPRLPS